MNAQSEPLSGGDQNNLCRHAEELAHQLVRHLGVNAARRTCTENHWTGVLNAINLLHHAD